MEKQEYPAVPTDGVQLLNANKGMFIGGVAVKKFMLN